MSLPDIHLSGMPYVPGTVRGRLQRGLSDNPAGCIVILEQTAPASIVHPPAGFVVIDGAPFSHGLIPLLGSGVPTVIVTRAQARGLRAGTEVLLDGVTGHITTACTATDRNLPPPAITAVTATADGVRVRLRASARDCRAARQAAAAGAEAIGLVRSEFLTPEDGRMPDAAFYHRELRALCEAAAPLPVTLRLIDIAADKHPAWWPVQGGTGGTLGLQGVRFYCGQPLQDIYRAQLEAVDALSEEFRLRVLLPHVADLDELRHWRDDIRSQLAQSVPVGAMAETPAAALQLGEWLGEADFAAVGCNDLMQCFFGADRNLPELRHYLDPHAPSLYRFLRQVAGAAEGHLETVQLCGVLPQLPGVLPLLLGLGFRVFSVEATLLSYLYRTIAGTAAADAGVLAARVCAAHSAAQVQALAGLPGEPGERGC